MSSVLERFRPRPVAAFSALTLAIWGNRIWLAWTNQEDSTAEKLVWSTPITLFVIAAAVVLVLQFRGRAGTPGFARLVRIFAGGTLVYWPIRIAIIATGDWNLPFKAVHTVLAVVSCAAAAWAWRSLVDRTPATAAAEPVTVP